MNRLVRKTLAALALVPALGGGAVSLPSRAEPSAPAHTDCANQRLPPEILDGPFSPAGGALPVVGVHALRAPLRLAVAANPENRELGLMCVTHLRARHGMIFVFPKSGEWDFWMKNTLVPLDMIWIAADGTVAAVAPNVPASTRTTPDAAIARRSAFGRYTLELNAGEAALDGLTVGARLHLPPLHAAR